MSGKVGPKVFLISLFLLIANVSFSFATNEKEDKCSCYNLCSKNFTTNSLHDVQKIKACQRGCRFFTLVLHSSRELDYARSLNSAKEGCLLSCSEGYLSLLEVSACKFGCSTVELSRILCNTVEIQTPQISYSFLIEESDILIHPDTFKSLHLFFLFFFLLFIIQAMLVPLFIMLFYKVNLSALESKKLATFGEPEPDDALTDPGLRKQIQKTLVAFLDSTPKIPEIRFKNLPVKTEKLSELSHTNFKCPKFYGLDSKFEFRNGKIIIGDLYLFVGVFLFVVLCFLLGHLIDTKNIKNEFIEQRLPRKYDFDDREHLKFNCKIIEKKDLSKKSEIFDVDECEPNTKSDDFSLIFDEEDFIRKKEPLDYFVKN